MLENRILSEGSKNRRRLQNFRKSVGSGFLNLRRLGFFPFVEIVESPFASVLMSVPALRAIVQV